MDKKELLELRRRIKKKKPNFIRQDAHKRSRLNKRWRRPKGIQSKMRLHKSGYRKSISVGYGSPRAVFGLHSTGLKPELVNSLKDLENIDSKVQGIILSHSIGQKKKTEMILKAKEKGITILNVKDIDKFLKNMEDKIKSQQERKKAKDEEKSKKKKEAEKTKVKGDKKLSDKLSDEEKKDEEKKEKDKLLTKKGN